MGCVSASGSCANVSLSVNRLLGAQRCRACLPGRSVWWIVRDRTDGGDPEHHSSSMACRVRLAFFLFLFLTVFFLTDVPVQPGYLWRKKNDGRGEKNKWPCGDGYFAPSRWRQFGRIWSQTKHSMGVSARFPFWTSRPSRGVGILAGVVDTEMREIGDWRHQRDGTGHRVACRCARDLVSDGCWDCWVPSWLLSWVLVFHSISVSLLTCSPLGSDGVCGNFLWVVSLVWELSTVDACLLRLLPKLDNGKWPTGVWGLGFGFRFWVWGLDLASARNPGWSTAAARPEGTNWRANDSPICLVHGEPRLWNQCLFRPGIARSGHFRDLSLTTSFPFRCQHEQPQQLGLQPSGPDSGDRSNDPSSSSHRSIDQLISTQLPR